MPKPTGPIDMTDEGTGTPTVNPSTTDTTTSNGNSQNVYDLIGGSTTPVTDKIRSQGNTGSGIEAAIGTEYSWDKTAKQQANTQYQIDVLNAKQQAVENRNTIEQNAKNYQQDVDLMQYKHNQEAEKVGWTGGYVLDQKQQEDFIKASIQAQLYGSMMLQKYGQDTSLAAARLSYDLNQKEFQQKYMDSAITHALQEANQTQLYISAENREMLSQLYVADEELRDIREKHPDAFDGQGNLRTGADLGDDIKRYEQAVSVKGNIEKWYTDNNISKEGIVTFEAFNLEYNLNQQYSQDMWTRYYTMLKDFNDKYADSGTVYARYDGDTPVFDGMNIQTVNFETMPVQEAVDYAKSGNMAKQQLYGYLNYTITDAINKYVDSQRTHDENGLIKSDTTSLEELEKVVKDLFETGTLKDFKNSEEAKSVLENYRYNNSSIDGYTIQNYSFYGDNSKAITKNQSTATKQGVASIGLGNKTDTNGWNIEASLNLDSLKLRFDITDTKGGTTDIAVKTKTANAQGCRRLIYKALDLDAGHAFGEDTLRDMKKGETKIIKNGNKYVIVHRNESDPNIGESAEDSYSIAYSGTIDGISYNTEEKWQEGFRKIVNSVGTNKDYLLDITNW